MAEYICKLGTEGGEIVEKRLAGADRGSLRRELEESGYHVFRIRPSLASLLPLDRRRRIKPDKFIIFNQEFRALLDAGLPATQSLDVLIGRQGESELGLVLRDVREAIETGASLSEAFAAHGERLPTAYVSTLVAGERSGDLPEALGRYIDLSKLTNKIRRDFRQALYYPIFLVFLSAGLLFLMLTHVLPEFAKFYDGFEAELPGFTLAVIGLAGALRSHWPALLLALAAATGAYLWWRQTEGGSRLLAAIKFRVPIAGELARKYQLSQTYHSLAMMLRGGMPLLGCLGDLARSAANPLLEDGLEEAGRRVGEGESLHDSIGGTVLAEELAVEMIQVGERTGSLAEMLGNVADFYDEEVRGRLAALLSLVEPIMLVLMATLIGSLLFAMYYPLFNLLGRFGG